jgi:RNA polymerase-interacting CarD/CdnL/TRCF family regulator
MFKNKNLVDSGEIDGSRYKYLKEKLEGAVFKKSIEVLHDLSSLRQSKEISSSERNIYNELKPKMIAEISHVLGTSSESIEAIIDFTDLKE